MTHPTMLVLAALVLLSPGAAIRAEAATATTQPATAEVQRLQGTWEGVLVGQESAGRITITFNGNSLHYQGLRADQWYDATFTLPEGTRPRQIRATITGSAQVKDIGTVIGAIFKIENRTLSLAGLEDDGTPDDSAVFDGNPMFHYKFRKLEPLAKP
jgi:uncharacterized protein (TIGR03067 family)